MPTFLQVSADELARGNNAGGNPGDDTRTVQGDAVLEAGQSAVLTFNDAGTTITRIDVYSAENVLIESYWDQNNTDEASAAGSGSGAPIQSDQQADAFGGFQQIQNLRLDGSGSGFAEGTAGSFLFVAPGSTIGQGGSVSFSGNSDDNGDGVVGFDPAAFPENVVCFASGTEILTPDGPRAVETLAAGDLIITRDHGPCPIRWIGARTVSGHGRYAPVQISAGTLGTSRDLLVSPQHRMAVDGARAEVVFGTQTALVPAEALLDGERIFRRPMDRVTYHHIALDHHAVIFAEGAAAESFLPTAADAAVFGPRALEELTVLFLELSATPASDVLTRAHADLAVDASVPV